jgi:superfamily II DNA or RNA helicase
MVYELDEYQEKFIRDISIEVKRSSSVIAQLATGGGKTVCFAAITKRYLQSDKGDVIIFCDSDEILLQTRKTLMNWYGIDTDVIDANSSQIKTSSLFSEGNRVFVAMVETFDRRSKRDTFLSQVKNVGLVIIDECHMGNFNKILNHFLFALKIGFTATPIASKKTEPLSKYYNAIVCGPQIEWLIEFGNLKKGRGLVRDVTYRFESINIKELEAEELALGYKGEDHNQELVGKKLSAPKQIQNTIDQYVKYAAGKKMICFNANVEHSLSVTKEMQRFGINARHLDATCGDQYRKDCYKWLKETANAVLCNVGMTIKGFDEPSLDGVIMNTLTKSVTKYIQALGRASRPYQREDGSYKDHFIVLDMCDNVMAGGHGLWSQSRDWKYIFENPLMPKAGVAPSKLCPECGCPCSASARICRSFVKDFFNPDGDLIECGYEFEFKVGAESTCEGRMVLVSKNVDVESIIDFPKFANKKEYFTLYETIRSCAYFYSQETKIKFMDQNDFEIVWESTHAKIKEWQTITGRRSESKRKKNDSDWYKRNGRSSLYNYLKEYGFNLEFANPSEKEPVFASVELENYAQKLFEENQNKTS